MTLADFLLARVAEDEAAIEGTAANEFVRTGESFSARFMSYESDHTYQDSAYVDRFDPARMLAECEAKRRIIRQYERARFAVAVTEAQEPFLRGVATGLDAAMIVLAQPYVDHPDYNPEWRVA
jgi:hypothetical protein